nr:MAG TPA: hypothetical protein [Caudoviricetes sp.]
MTTNVKNNTLSLITDYEHKPQINQNQKSRIKV